jgi:hypothetical protein
MKDILPSVESVYVIDKDQQAPLPLLNITSASTLPAMQSKATDTTERK